MNKDTLIKFLAFICLFLLISIHIYGEHVYIRGDADGDSQVNICDVTTIINYLLSDNDSNINLTAADCNKDGMVNISDITSLIDYLLRDEWAESDLVFTVNGVTFKMIKVQGGTFTMGGTAEQGYDVCPNEKPTHEVTLSSYYICETEVTQALWLAVMGDNPSNNTGDQNLPVEQVSYIDCQSFFTKLNEMTGQSFRFPTEAQWEFAARGGNLSMGYKFSGNNVLSEVGWYNNNSGYSTHPVATKAPNELGLYDMSGNVFEWCSDWYDASGYSSEPQTDPIGYVGLGCNYRMARGGAFNHNYKYSRVSYREIFVPQTKWYFLGLRLAL